MLLSTPTDPQGPSQSDSSAPPQDTNTADPTSEPEPDPQPKPDPQPQDPPPSDMYILPARVAELTDRDIQFVLDGTLLDLLSVWNLTAGLGAIQGAQHANLDMLYLTTQRFVQAFERDCKPNLEEKRGALLHENVLDSEGQLQANPNNELTLEEIVMHRYKSVDIMQELCIN